MSASLAALDRRASSPPVEVLRQPRGHSSWQARWVPVNCSHLRLPLMNAELRPAQGALLSAGFAIDVCSPPGH
jgi:hypothetical protein